MDLPILTAFWLGLLTSISPCPLATNIAAVSYISKDVSSRKTVILSALLYSLGRMVSYFLIGLGLIGALFNIFDLSFFLQDTIDIVLGCILVVSGLLLWLANKVSFSLTGTWLSRLQNYVAQKGIWGSFFLGILFALAFCPVTAALFFGNLIPLAVTNTSGILYPMVYGIGTGLPVIILSILAAWSINWVSRAYNKLKIVEKILRNVTGTLFILVGIYFIFLYFEVDLIFGWFITG